VTTEDAATAKRASSPSTADRAEAAHAQPQAVRLRTDPDVEGVGQLAAEFNLPAELSLDEHMGCGIGFA